MEYGIIPKCDEFISCFWAAAQSVPIVPLNKKDTSLQSYSSASVLVSCVSIFSTSIFYCFGITVLHFLFYFFAVYSLPLTINFLIY